MPITFSPRWSPRTCLFFAYLTTIPLWRAVRLLAFWDRAQRQLDDFARLMLQGIPVNFFSVPLVVPDEPHFSINNGHLRVLTDEENAADPLRILPSDLEPFLAAWKPRGLPTARTPTRLRPLNSFMAFRTFVAVLFPGMLQKDKSMLISIIWQNDPFKAQWAVLAKAYTHLRDHFTLNDQTLSTFIEVTRGLFNFPTPDRYLVHLGWKIDGDSDGAFHISRTTGRLTFRLPNDPVSVNDVLFFCAARAGYATQKPESMWPFFFATQDEVFVTNDQGEMRDPFRWLMDDRGNILTGPINEFNLEDLYNRPDPDMDPNDLDWNPPYNQSREENGAIEKAEVMDDVRSFLEEPWIELPGFSLFPATLVAGQS